MIERNQFPKVQVAFDASSESASKFICYSLLDNILQKILPEDLFSDDHDFENKKKLDEFLPFVTYTESKGTATELSFYAVLKFRINSFKFFYEMITHWLVPGHRLNVSLVYAVDFTFPKLGDQLYTLCEVLITVDQKEQLQIIKDNFLSIASELRLGLPYAYHARRILEIRGLTTDEKTANIQERIAGLPRRLPSLFDRDILSEMQHTLVMCRDEFKMARSSRDLSRIISAHYLFRKRLQKSLTKEPNKRHILVKLINAKVNANQKEKSVLGIIVGLNFIKDKEIFEKRHLLYSIQQHIPDAKEVKASFFNHRRSGENIALLYLEVEKSSGELFGANDFLILKAELPKDLMTRVGCLMHPLFMPRNEEEVMRNILTLSSQIKYIRDIPQVCINFDEQTAAELSFTVVLARVVPPGSPSIASLFKVSKSNVDYVQDRCKTLGFLRGKYAKEATVFRIKLRKDKFIRKDHSIDLYKARQEVVLSLLEVIGEFRDFNGGMITKQHELLAQVRYQLKGAAKKQELLLENFFYSLTPVIMRTVLEPEGLSHLFALLLQVILEPLDSGNSFYQLFDHTENFVYAVVKYEGHHVREVVSQAVSELQIPSTQLATSQVIVHDQNYLSYIYRCDEEERQKQFLNAISLGLEGWVESQAVLA